MKYGNGHFVRGSISTRKGNRWDSAWKYGIEVEVPGGTQEYVYIGCNSCDKVVKGNVQRLKEHLGCTHKDVVIWPKVLDEVKQEINAYLKKSEVAKKVAQQRFDNMVDSRSYFRYKLFIEKEVKIYWSFFCWV